MSFARALPTADQYARADMLVATMRMMRPDLPQALPIDQWIAAHWDRLTPLERRAATAVRDLHPDHRTQGG